MAARRSAGLMILSRPMSLRELSTECQLDLCNWFSSSMRQKQAKLCGYLENIKQCGVSIEAHLRKHFFAVFNSVLEMVKRAREKETVIRLLDSLNWRFLARDHQLLHESKVFKVLREGDGHKNHPIRQAWGKATGQKTWQPSEEPTSLQFCLLDLFETLFLNVVSRIVDSDQTQLKLKEKGTSIPLIERSKSLLQTSVSETLLGDGMQVIFSELNRYTSSLKSFKGIDYQTFVILYNKTMI
jgi:hypothetical protein